MSEICSCEKVKVEHTVWIKARYARYSMNSANREKMYVKTRSKASRRSLA